MNIGIDCGALSIKDERLKVGVYRSNFDLLRELSKIDKKNHYLLYSFSSIKKDILNELGNNFENKIITPQIGWLNVRLSIEFLTHKPDIFIGVSQALPLYHPLKSIVFIYDLAFEFFPECYIGSYKRLHFQTKKAAKESTIIIVPTNKTKKDLINLYNISPEKIITIYQGVDSVFSPVPKNEIKKTISNLNINDKYFLFVGSLKPIKNISRILESFEVFSSKTKEKYQLVISGSNYWNDESIKIKIEKLEKKGIVKYLGFVEDKKLPALYSGALALVSPSLYEGFGRPLVEAMACGCPVITGNSGSMPEVVENAGILVNSKEIGDIVKAMKKIVGNTNLRNELIRKGLYRVKIFRWENFGRKVYEQIKTIKK